MILVTLGTQDKIFKRLLEQIDKEIKNGNISDKVIVQAGYTYKYFQSNNMEIFDYIETKQMEKLIKESDFIISHAGVGTILTALENNKKIIVVPRLKEFKEHHNNHQVEIAQCFSEAGYVIYLEDLNDLHQAINNINKFKPKKLLHNNEVIDTIQEFIDNIF